MYNFKTKSRKMLFFATAIFLVLALVGGVTLGVLSDGFKDWSKFQKSNNPLTNSGVTDADGNDMVSETVYPMPANMLFTAPTSLSATAKSGITLQATIAPDSATNKEVDWTATWVNATSAWAEGKTMTDYVTITPTSDGALTAVVSCTQPFGEKVNISVISRDNPEAKASCVVDFSQKVTGATLNFGNLPINLGGTTNVKFEVNPAGVGLGGVVEANYSTSEVYTTEDNFTYDVKLQALDSGVYFQLKGMTISTAFNYADNLVGSEFYFNYTHSISKWLILRRQGDILFKNLSTAQIIDYFSDITNGQLFHIEVTISGKYSSFTASSLVVCTGYTNQASVASVVLNSNALVI